MTREEAIRTLKWFKEYNEEDFCGGDRIQDEYGDWFYRITEQDFEAFDSAIKALEQESTTKIEESNFSQEQYLADTDCAYDCGYNKGFKDGIKSMSDKPSGKWEIQNGILAHLLVCSNCGNEINITEAVHLDYYKKHFKYCPNCGADMRGEE